MRQQRAKRYRKAMAIYQTSFQFREPYQVLLSSDFILAAHRFKLDLANLLQRTFQGDLKLSKYPCPELNSNYFLVISQCCIAELYKNKDPAPIALAKKCERRRCGHIPDPLSSHDCLTSCINIHGENKHRYILATQDENLRGAMRQIPGVPMVYIRRAVMIMEPPSPVTLNRREELERKKLGGLERTTATKRIRGDGDEEDEEKLIKKKKGSKEPNPLSVKKRKPKSEGNAASRRVPTAGEEDGPRVNIIGEVTDSLRRRKSTRRRRRHKKSTADSAPETIPAEVEE